MADYVCTARQLLQILPFHSFFLASSDLHVTRTFRKWPSDHSDRLHECRVSCTQRLLLLRNLRLSEKALLSSFEINTHFPRRQILFRLYFTTYEVRNVATKKIYSEEMVENATFLGESSHAWRFQQASANSGRKVRETPPVLLLNRRFFPREGGREHITLIFNL